MRQEVKRPVLPPDWWWPDNASAGVEAYLYAHYEFDARDVQTDFPYHGCNWRDKFRSEPGHGWTLRRDHILNNLTADLIAAAERLSPKLGVEKSPGMPGGISTEGATVSVALLDGGISVEFTQYEHQYTNRVHAYQKTRIIGPQAFRVLLQFLGFDPPRGRLKGEPRLPDGRTIAALAQAGHDRPDGTTG